MNALSAMMKILAAAAVIAGAVFAVITYGDKLMSIAKQFLSRLGITVSRSSEDDDFVDEYDLVDEEPVAADQDFEG